MRAADGGEVGAAGQVFELFRIPELQVCPAVHLRDPLSDSGVLRGIDQAALPARADILRLQQLSGMYVYGQQAPGEGGEGFRLLRERCLDPDVNGALDEPLY